MWALSAWFGSHCGFVITPGGIAAPTLGHHPSGVTQEALCLICCERYHRRAHSLHGSRSSTRAIEMSVGTITSMKVLTPHVAPDSSRTCACPTLL